MRDLVVLAALLVTPIAADADFVFDMRPIDVEVRISVAGTVPLAGGDLVLDDAFVLTGTAGALIFVAIPPPPSVFQSEREVHFLVSGGGTSASGTVFAYEDRAFGLRGFASLSLDTPLYSLGFSENPGGHISMGAPIQTVFFEASSHGARVTVGGENSSLLGTASYSGTGHAAVPEPEATILLLVLGVTSIAVWRRRGA